MPDKTGRRTPQETLWVGHMARTGDPVYAAEKAGYRSPAARASQNLAKPELMEDVAQETMRELIAGGPIAARRLIGIVSNPKSTDANAIAAAKVILPYSAGAAAESKQPHEMSAAEIQKAIYALRREDAVTVEHETAAQPEMGCL